MALRWLAAVAAILQFLFSASSGTELRLHDQSFAPDIILRATQIDAALACRFRKSVVINGTSPGPPIYLKEGKTSWIRVFNDILDQNLTVHWHGLSQSVAPFSDGTPRASQWPIAPKHFFDYEVRPKIGEAGSYFYHSHVGFQAVSAAGPLIVEEAAESICPYKYDDEKIFFITDLFNRSDTSIENGLVANPFVWSAETEAVLVNGQSMPAISATQAQEDNPDPPPRPGSPKCGPEIFNVKPDTTYRFRFISDAALSYVTMAFEGHDNLTIIGADGAYTRPFSVNHLQIGTGQRFEVLLKTKSEQELQQLRKRDFYIQMEIRDRPINLTSYAILSYGSSVPSVQVPKVKPLKLPELVGGWLEYALEPLKDNNFPSAAEVTRRVYLSNKQFYTRPDGDGASFWALSQHSWRATRPGKPYLVSIYENGDAAIPSVEEAMKYGGWDPKTDTWPADTGEVLEIILLNRANDAGGTNDIHPWHAHGGHYYDIGSGKGNYDPSENERKLRGYNPVLRDTTMLYKEDGGVNATAPEGSITGWRGWRIRVQDTGVWMIHCHTLQHMLMGMQTVWIMGNASEITSKSLPYSRGYFTYGGDVYGNTTHAPHVMHYFDDIRIPGPLELSQNSIF